ncbi:MAG TPA: HAD family phosphatase [Bacteroidota bacterium]|nr:HAD family phosphatase [Bacteroidota bacterium]
MERNIKALIFDMDGVLIDSYSMHKEALEITAKEYGITVSEEDFISIFGKTSYEGIKSLPQFSFWSDEKIYEFNDKQDGRFREIFKTNPRYIEGSKLFLKKIYEKGYLIGIGTSAPKANAEVFLSVFGNNGFFRCVITGDDVLKGKPDPEIYLKCAEALNQKPENCVVFEDSIMGIKSAKSAGATVIALTTTHKADELKEADYIIKNFVDPNLNLIFKELKIEI